MTSEMEVHVEQLTSLTCQNLEDIEELLRVLSPDHQIDEDKIAGNIIYQIEHPEHYGIFVAKCPIQIIGKASVKYFQRDLDAEARLEDVAVLPNFSGKRQDGTRVSDRLENACSDWAVRKGANHIELTSAPSRVPANKTYERLGYELRNTNVRRKQL